jgi:ribosomal protein L29
MKKTDIQKLATKSVAELQKEIIEAREKLWQQKRDVVSGKVKNPHSVTYLRRDIARMLTVVQNKKNSN